MQWQLFVESKDFILTEGPHWEASKNYVYFVDAFGKSLHRVTYSSGEVKKAKFEDVVTSVIPRANHSSVIVTTKLNICSYDFETEALEVLCTVAPGDNTRLNDSKCDSTGRMWTGSMGYETKPGVVPGKIGSMFSYDGAGVLKKHADEILISNGFGWSLDGKTLYYIDSCTRMVAAYDCDLNEAKISNKRVCIDFAKTEAADVLPDGLCVDSEGMLWVALYRGWKVVRCNPNTGEIIDSLSLPVAQVTSCCFAGENLDHLIVTTGRMGLSDEELKEQPLAGCVFRFKDMKVKGQPGVSFNG